jgi:hypothetical protein
MKDGHHETLWDFVSSLFETTNEKITAAISGAAIISPAFPTFKQTSDTATLLMPILGCLWLLSQIAFKWYAHFSRPKDGPDGT